jgi:hypothetical protein
MRIRGSTFGRRSGKSERLSVGTPPNVFPNIRRCRRGAEGSCASTRRRGRTVARKVTGKRPDYGSLQMRHALLPALENDKEKVYEAMEHALDRVSHRFNRY